MKQVYILGGLLAVSLVGAYVTYTAEDAPEKTEGVVIASVDARALSAIVWESEEETIRLTRPSDAAGDYFLVEVTERKPVDPTTPSEPADTDEGDDDEAEAPEATDAPAEVVETHERFTGNTAAADLWEAFTPLMGLRELTVDGSTDLAAFGLDDPSARLVLERGGGPIELKVGGEAYGTRDRYVGADNRIYLVDDKTLRPLEYAGTRLVERRLHDLEDADVEAVQVRRRADERRFVQRNADDRAKAYWADAEQPESKDIEGATWLDKLFKLRVQAYVPGEFEGAPTPLFTFALSGSGKTWQVEVLEGTKEGAKAYYARSTFNRAPVELTRSLAEEVIADLDTLFDGEPGEEPAGDELPVDDAAPDAP